jgi:hypothetical protein
MIRSKFKVLSVESSKDGFGGVAGTVRLEAVISQDPEHENKVFTDLTPSGFISIGITKPETLAFYEVGAEYYVDFTKAE